MRCLGSILAVLILLSVDAATHKPFLEADFLLASEIESKVIRACVRPGDTVFDAGANIGDWMREVILHCKPSLSRLHAFEPVPETFQALSTAFSGQDNLKLNQLALWEEITMKDFFVFEDGSRFSGFHNRSNFAIDHFRRRHIQVRTTTLSHYCRQAHVTEIRFLKLDVEGAELAVLWGAEGLLVQHKIDFIQFEYGGTYLDSGSTLEETFGLLSGNGYVMFKLVGSDQLLLIRRWYSSLEDWTWNTFLAVKPELVPNIPAASARHAPPYGSMADAAAATIVVAVVEPRQGATMISLSSFAAIKDTRANVSWTPIRISLADSEERATKAAAVLDGNLVLQGHLRHLSEAGDPDFDPQTEFGTMRQGPRGNTEYVFQVGVAPGRHVVFVDVFGSDFSGDVHLARSEEIAFEILPFPGWRG